MNARKFREVLGNTFGVLLLCGGMFFAVENVMSIPTVYKSVKTKEIRVVYEDGRVTKILPEGRYDLVMVR